jgi:hypothetical protein
MLKQAKTSDQLSVQSKFNFIIKNLIAERLSLTREYWGKASDLIIPHLMKD